MGLLPLGDGLNVEVPGVAVTPLLQTQQTTARTVAPRAIFLHTNTGERHRIETRAGDDPRAEQLQEYAGRTTRAASWDFATDGDSISVSNLLLQRFTWGQGAPNPYSITIEMTVANGVLDTRTLRNTCDLVDTLTAVLRIQRQMPIADEIGVIDRLAPSQGNGRDCTGIFEHRNAAFRGERGAWDAGEAILRELATRGYERFAFNRGQDLDVWRERQRDLGIPQTGVPLLPTADALAARGYACGLWISRPIGCPPVAADVLAVLRTFPRRRQGSTHRGSRATPSPIVPPTTAPVASSWRLPAVVALGAVAWWFRDDIRRSL